MYPICHSSNETLIITFFAYVVSVDLGFLLAEQKYFFLKAEYHRTLIYDCYLESIFLHVKE